LVAVGIEVTRLLVEEGGTVEIRGDGGLQQGVIESPYD